jgi:hypothetical protein
LLGGDLFRDHLRGKAHLPREGSIVNLDGKDLLWTTLGRCRLGSSPNPIEEHPIGLDPQIDVLSIHACEVETDPDATFTSIGVHRRSPALRLRVASAGKLVGLALELTVIPFELNDFVQGMYSVRARIALCV